MEHWPVRYTLLHLWSPIQQAIWNDEKVNIGLNFKWPFWTYPPIPFLILQHRPDIYYTRIQTSTSPTDVWLLDIAQTSTSPTDVWLLDIAQTSTLSIDVKLLDIAQTSTSPTAVWLLDIAQTSTLPIDVRLLDIAHWCIHPIIVFHSNDNHHRNKLIS